MRLSHGWKGGHYVRLIIARLVRFGGTPSPIPSPSYLLGSLLWPQVPRRGALRFAARSPYPTRPASASASVPVRVACGFYHPTQDPSFIGEGLLTKIPFFSLAG